MSLGVYYEWGHDDKGTYAKMTMNKYVNKLVDGYDTFTGSNVKFQKTPGSPGRSQIKRKLKDPTDIDKYRLLVGHIKWYTIKVRTDVLNP